MELLKQFSMWFSFVSTYHDSNNFLCRRNILLLSNELPQNIVLYIMIGRKYETYTALSRFLVSINMRDLIAKHNALNLGKVTSMW